MRFSLFVHMERTNNDQSYQLLHHQFLELAQMAEVGGFDGLWTGEHHGMDFTISPNPFLLLIELAQKTKSLRLGTGTVVAPFWHPLRLAGEAAMADLITNGRIDLGIARGAYSYEYERIGCGIDAWGAGQHLREMIPALQGLWKGDYSHKGECWNFPKSTAIPKAIQDGGPPIWVAARDPSSFEFSIAHDCNIQVTPLWNDDEEVKGLMQKFIDAKAKTPDKKSKIMLLRHIAVGLREEEIQQSAVDMSHFYCHFGAWFRNERNVNNGLLEPLTAEEMEKMEMFSPEKMRYNNVIGTPDQVSARIETYQKMGYDELSFWIDTGASFENKKRSLKYFIDHVLVNFKEK